tara:strand:- start:631 stop:1140 length:510 start_codon:yes stop_codon:yes gene_type:complete
MDLAFWIKKIRNKNEIAKRHWILRVGDGENFKNSNYPAWGVKKGKGKGNIKGIVKKMKKGDVLWFLKSKNYGGNIIGVAEYDTFYDRNDEPLIMIHTYTNNQQNWKGKDVWDIQINYKNLYMAEKQNIKVCIQCSATIMRYSTFKEKISEDLIEHYNNFKFYAEPIDKF